MSELIPAEAFTRLAAERARALAVVLEQQIDMTRQHLVSVESAWRITSRLSAGPSAWLYDSHADDVAEIRAALEADHV